MTETTGRIGHIVLIDDDEVDQLLHQRIIRKSGVVDYLHSFRRAAEALAFLADGGEADLILLDIRMPEMDGFEFLDAVTASFGQDFPTVVMMLTTSLDDRDQARAASYDIVKGYLNKPLARDHVPQLVNLVQEVTRPPVDS